MADCEYWKGITAKLKTASDANWAAHVLASDEENVAAVRECIPDAEIIDAVISAYGDGNWSTQSYCDEILSQFEKEAVEQVFGHMTEISDDVTRGIERFLTL